MNVKRMVCAVAGCVALGLGALGAVLPILPTVPFLMLATVCFSRSSARLDAWFKSTRLYRDNLADYVAGRGMTRATKVRIMVTVTVLMAVGFACMRAVPAAQVVLACVWLAHVAYFGFRVKTLDK